MICRQIRHCEKAFSAGEAIFLTRITSRKDFFVVPPRNDDLSKSVNGSGVEGPYNDFYSLSTYAPR